MSPTPSSLCSDSVEQIVMDRIDKDQQFAADTLRGLTDADRKSMDSAFVRFFPHLRHTRGQHWSNLPSGIKLAHYLIVGVTPVLDLEPLPPDTFEEAHGLTVSTAEALIDDGRILANLYVRDPAAWRGMHHLQGLVTKSVVNGVRVDHWLNTLNPEFEKASTDEKGLKARRAQQFAQALAKAPDQLQEVRKISRARDDEGIAPLEGHQWAYLDVLTPEAAAKVEELVTEGQLITAMEYLRLVKRAYISPYTASLCGTCVWGPTDNDRWIRRRSLLSEELVIEKEWSDLEILLKRPPGALQFLVEELTRTPGVGLVTTPSAAKILELQAREDWQTVKRSIFDLLLDLTRLARKDGYDAGKVDELRRWMSEQRTLLERYQLGGAISGGSVGRLASGLVGYAIGGVFTSDPSERAVIAATTAGFLGMPLSRVGKTSGRALGDWGHKLAKPEHHRVIATLDSLTKSERASST